MKKSNNKHNFTNPFEEFLDFGDCEDNTLEKEFYSMINHKDKDTQNNNTVQHTDSKIKLNYRLLRRKQDHAFILIILSFLLIGILAILGHESTANILAATTVLGIIKNMFGNYKK